MRRLPACVCCVSLSWFAACGPNDQTVAEESSTSSDTSEVGSEEASSEAGVTSGESATSGETETTDTTGTTGGVDDSVARGITIKRVEANPGAGIPLSIDGREATFEERYTRLPSRRQMWVFIDVEVEAGWQAREIEARFTIHPQGGEPITASQIVEITQNTADWKQDPEGGYDSIIEMRDWPGFQFGLPAELMLPDVGWSLSLHEVDPSFLAEPLPADPPVLPPVDAGTEKWPIGIESSNNVFRLVMVPIAMDYGGCTETPPYDEETIGRYVDHQFASNPVEEVDVTIHDPYPWNQPISSGNDLSAILNAMSQLKSQEGAGPEVYYYALINNCGTCISGGGQGCIVGQARLPGDGMDSSDSLSRVGSGLQSTSTFVHELGHAQGRRHINCEGAGAAGTDPSYPHNNGTLGSWGFDMRQAFLHNPALGYDYMSYCGPSWVSNWQWEATYKRIETLSSWGDVEPPYTTEVLMMHIDENGDVQTWTTQGWVDGTRAAQGDSVDFFDGALELGSMPARVTETAHGTGKQVAVELPRDGRPDHLVFDHAGQRRVVRLDTLSAG